MSSGIVLQPARTSAALLDAREQLASVRNLLAEREAELAALRVQLRAFEGRCFQEVGVLYAELDEIEARIAEREVDLYRSDDARARAAEARRRAQETHDAAFNTAHPVAEFDPPPTLKSLFREVAKRIHPDFARDTAEREHFTLLMASANQAYRHGDTGTLERLLDDHREIHAAIAGESPEAELLRLTRQIDHARRDIAELDTERATLLASEIGQLHRDTEAAALDHRNLLVELASGLREQIADARYRFSFVDRQIQAHGR